MKKYNRKIVTLVILSTMLTACNTKDEVIEEEIDKSVINDGVVENEIKYGELKNIFAPGEHVVSVPVEDAIYKENVQYAYHSGYKPVGIICTGYGRTCVHNGGAAIIYVNTEKVLAYATGINEKSEVVFTDFGFLNEKTSDYTSEDYSNVHEFALGEHIVSIPFTVDVTEEMVQFPVYPGYELIGMAGASYGRTSDHFAGGALLFVNSENVECELVIDEEGNKSYSNMGKIVDTQDLNNKTLGLNQK